MKEVYGVTAVGNERMKPSYTQLEEENGSLLGYHSRRSFALSSHLISLRSNKREVHSRRFSWKIFNIMKVQSNGIADSL